jgi:hypothetical protein
MNPFAHTYSAGEYKQSLDDMLNGPCHMHYTYVDGKRVSRHAMKDCRTFIKLQEAEETNNIVYNLD